MSASCSRPNRPLFLILATAALAAHGADWVQPGLTTNQPVWGIRGGLLWAVPPAGFRGGEPRGLIRVGYPVLPGKRYDLVNFIAVEPVVKGRRGFSELEHSRLDNVAGKLIRAASKEGSTNMVAGTLTRQSAAGRSWKYLEG